MTVAHRPSDAAVWHDLECGSYRQDLPLWRSLAARHGGPVLEIGAGTGRVALDLAAAGHALTALEREPSLLTELVRRAAELPVTCVEADARRFRIDERFTLCIVAMQTIQLLGGADGRRAFLECARRHLRAEGMIAVAIVETLELFHATAGGPDLPAEACERNGVLYSSRPTAILSDAAGYVLERRREIVAASGERTALYDSVHIDQLTGTELEAEAIAVGLQPAGRTSVPPTPTHSGSTVVIFRA